MKTTTLILLLTALLAWAACRKTDRTAYDAPPENNTERFFHQHPPAGPLVTALQQKMQRENDQQPFIETIISRIGYPRWDKALVISPAHTSGRGGSADSSIVYIPFVRDSQNFVNAALLFKLSPTDTSYQYLADWQYAGYGFDSTGPGLHARDVFHLFARLDGAVFGRTEFEITDARLFGPIPSGNKMLLKLKPQSAGGKRTDVQISYQVCSIYDICVGPGWEEWCNGGCTVDCPWYVRSETECITYWIDDGWQPGGGGGSATGGGSTGGGGGYPPPVCGGTAARTDQDPACPTGWQPVGGGAPAPNANQSIIDSLQGYPCAQDVLMHMPGCNAATDSILSKIFGKNDKVNVIFKPDSTLAPSVNGKTDFDKFTFKADGTMNIYIGLNPILLKNASKECIAKVMIHESVHAYIDYYWIRYKNNLIDSNEFKMRFPKVWQYKNVGNSQHEQIALSYVGIIKSIIHDYNPEISDSLNTAMAFNGLPKTRPWINLGSDTTWMIGLYNISKYGTKAEMLSHHLHKCPPQ